MEHKFNVGDTIRVTGTVTGCQGAESRTGIFTEEPSNAGLLATDDGINLRIGERVWRVNGKFELVSSAIPEKWAVRGCKTLTENIDKVFNGGKVWVGDSENLFYFLDKYGRWDGSKIKSLPQGYTEITEEQFKQIVEKELNKTKPIPDNWYVTITQHNRPVIKKWFELEADYSIGAVYGVFNGVKESRAQNWVTDLSWEEITFEQFKEHILNKKEMKTYKVTREQLAEIYGIACTTWKPKIEKITTETLGAFGTEGELSEEIVQSMRDAATSEQRPVIDRIFPMPKKKVKKEVKVYLNIYPNGNINSHRTIESAGDAAGKDAVGVGVEYIYEYEVEE